MANVKGTATKEMQEMMEKLQALEAQLAAKDEMLVELASRVKPTARKKIKYATVEYLDERHTELGLNAKTGIWEHDKNKEGLPQRYTKAVLSYLYGTGERSVKYFKDFNQDEYQKLFIEDAKDFIVRNREQIVGIIAAAGYDCSIVSFSANDIVEE